MACCLHFAPGAVTHCRARACACAALCSCLACTHSPLYGACACRPAGGPTWQPAAAAATTSRTGRQRRRACASRGRRTMHFAARWAAPDVWPAPCSAQPRPLGLGGWSVVRNGWAPVAGAHLHAHMLGLHFYWLVQRACCCSPCSPQVPASTLKAVLRSLQPIMAAGAAVVVPEAALQGKEGSDARVALHALEAAVAAAHVLATPGLPPEVYMEEVRRSCGTCFSLQAHNQ